MATATPTALRQTIIQNRQRGKTLHELAQEIGLSYTTVQSLCSRFKKEGEQGLKPRYAHCGKIKPSQADFIYRAVRCYKRWHPGWGAEKIRTELLLLRPELKLPSTRTMQRWFHYSGLAKGRDKQPREAHNWAKTVHEVWQIDAKEEMQTLDGNKNCWLNIKDEHSGAVIDPPVFPLKENM